MKVLLDSNVILDIALERQPFFGNSETGKIKEYTKNPGSASLLNSIIGSLVAVAAVNEIPIANTLSQIAKENKVKIITPNSCTDGINRVSPNSKLPSCPR